MLHEIEDPEEMLHEYRDPEGYAEHGTARVARLEECGAGGSREQLIHGMRSPSKKSVSKLFEMALLHCS